MSKYALRDYQIEAHEATLNFIEKNKNSKRKLNAGIVVLPTGSGKSLSIATLAKDYGKPILILCPSKEIVEQNYEKYISYGLEAGIWSASAGRKEIKDVTFATLGSVKSMGKDFKAMGVDLLGIDECHLSTNAKSGMFKTFIKDLSPKYLIGYTATPFRLESKLDETVGLYTSQLTMLNRQVPKFFTDIIYINQISHMIENNFWADFNQSNKAFDTSDLVLNSTGAEFTEASMQYAAKKNNVNNRIYKKIKEKLSHGVKSILVFVDSVENAHKMAKALGRYARVVDANTKKKDREEILNSFKDPNGDVKIVINYATLGVGFDFPSLEMVIMGRATNSLALYYQILGRLVRPSEGKKSWFYDYGGNIDRFGDIRNLTIENVEGYGWGVFIDDYLMTGKSLRGIRVHKDSLKIDLIETIMPFGKYKGQPLKLIPKSYLEWLVAQEGVGDDLVRAIQSRIAIL